jgi:Phosphoenolpyruvate-dependent sugar phosphotransferase system, EIIA 2
VPNKQKLLFELARKAGSRIRLPPDDVLTELSRREELGSTGIGDGIAMPHARFRQPSNSAGYCENILGEMDILRPPCEGTPLLSRGRDYSLRVAAGDCNVGGGGALMRARDHQFIICSSQFGRNFNVRLELG